MDALAAHPRRAAFSIHSFTPALSDGSRRPWHAGFLTRSDLRSSELLMRQIAREAPDLTVAVNRPYRIESETDWFIPQYAEPRNLYHSLIEIRNDQLKTESGTARWVELLSKAIAHVMEART